VVLRRNLVDMEPRGTQDARHDVKRHGKSKEGAKVYLMGANGNNHCMLGENDALVKYGMDLISCALIHQTQAQTEHAC
jgi:hypothetical protein